MGLEVRSIARWVIIWRSASERVMAVCEHEPGRLNTAHDTAHKFVLTCHTGDHDDRLPTNEEPKDRPMLGCPCRPHRRREFAGHLQHVADQPRRPRPRHAPEAPARRQMETIQPYHLRNRADLMSPITSSQGRTKAGNVRSQLANDCVGSTEAVASVQQPSAHQSTQRQTG